MQEYGVGIFIGALTKSALKKALKKQLGQLESKEILLPVEQILPEVTEEMAEETKNRAAKLLGNGWTVDVIAHIFKGLK